MKNKQVTTQKHYSPHANLVAIGTKIRTIKLLEPIEEPVQIRQGFRSRPGRAPSPRNRPDVEPSPGRRKRPVAGAEPGWSPPPWMVAGVAALVVLVAGTLAAVWLWPATDAPGPAVASDPRPDGLNQPGFVERPPRNPNPGPVGPGDRPPPDQGREPPPQAQQGEAGAAKPVAEVPGNLLVNGSFEEGPEPNQFDGYTTLSRGSTVIKGWEVVQGQVDYVGPFWQPGDGKRSIDLNGYVGGGISQSFKTRAGQKYRVTFSMAGVLYYAPAVKKLGVRAAGKSGEFEFDSTGKTLKDMGWATRSWDFVAAADDTTLEFYSMVDGANGPALDRVSVVAVNE